MKYYSQSISKRENRVINEDAALAKKGMAAVSDGAGGGGVFAELWSKYLLKQLPASALRDFQQLDAWVDGIWEPYYKDCEEKAKQQGALFLNKFYDEGSFATLAAVWLQDGKTAEWMTYGDSVVFYYDVHNHELKYSNIRLSSFDDAPYLIGSNAGLKEKGFHAGLFQLTGEEVIFVTTDALSHYILMRYELCHRENYEDEIDEAIAARTKNSNFIKVAEEEAEDFEKCLTRLLDAAREQKSFIRLMGSLEESGLLAHDDYSLTVLDCRQTSTKMDITGHAEEHAIDCRRKKRKVVNLKVLRRKRHQ
ncbi:MAG: hypothetical protein ACOCOG_07130 [Prevotella sp.]